MSITVSIGTDDLLFNADDSDYNRYLDELSPTNKVQASWNFVSRTVDDSSRALLNNLALTETNVPKGLVVVQIAAVLAQELGGDLSITVKKPKPVPSGSDRMATDRLEY